MIDRIAAGLTRWTYRAWPLVLAAFVFLSILSIQPSVRLFKNISTDPIDLLPKKHPNVQTLLRVKEKLEKGMRGSIVVESGDRAANLRMIQDITAKLKNEPWVSRVEYTKVGYDFFDRHKLLFMELSDLRTIRDRLERKIRKEKLFGLFVDLEEDDEEFSFKDLQKKYKTNYSDGVSSMYHESPDGRIFAMWAESRAPNTGFKAASDFQDQLERFAKTLRPADYNSSMKLYISGATKVFEYRALVKDLTRVGIVSGILIFIPLLFRFHNILHVFWVFLPLLIGIPISFAASSFFVDKLNLCTSFLFAILGGLGIENGIHIFSRYYESRSDGETQKKALHEIFSHTGRAILTSVASVAVTFLSLIWNDFRGFSEFGLIAGVGLWIIFGVYFLFMPSLLVFLERIKLLRFRRVAVSTKETLIFTPWFLRGSLVAGILFSIFSLSVIAYIRFEYDSKKLRAEIPEVLIAQAKRRQTVKRINSPAVIVVHSKAEAEVLKEAVEKVAREDNLSPTIDTSRSYYDLFPEEQAAKMKVVRQIKKLLEDKAIRLLKGDKKKDVDEFRKIVHSTEPVSASDIPEELVEVFKGKPSVPGEIFYINAIPNLELDDGRNAMHFADDVSKLNTKGAVYYPSSDAIIYGKVLQTMLADAPRVMLFSFLLVALFVFFDFRSVKKTAIVMTSIVLGVLWMFGVMWMMGVKLNFYNMIIIPAVLGMSIDNSIHIFHRYQELGFGSLPRVLSSSGKAALLASVTNASGFIGLLFCVHKGLYSIGLMAVIGVCTCLLSTLVFLPAMLEFSEKIRLDRKRVLP